jgi:perosamine synthetase
MIPLSVQNFEGNEEKYVADAVSQGWVSTGGAYVDALEKRIAEYSGSVGSVACQSGTAALHMS